MKKKLLLASIPVIVLIICCLGALLLLDSGSGQEEVYVQQIEMADKYFASNDYDNAVIYYKKAIDADNTQEKPYLALADIYFSKSDLINAVNILELGQKNVGSEQINNMLARYTLMLNEASSGASEPKPEAVKMVSGTVGVVSTYNYSQYANGYTVQSESYDNGVYKVKYLNFGAEFLYYNTNDNKNIINSSTHKPNPTARPSEIHLESISLLFSGASRGVTLEQIKSLEVNSVKKEFDSGLNIYAVTFTKDNCIFTVECDKDGNITKDDAYNKIIPMQTAQNSEKITVSGIITDGTTNGFVPAATLNFRTGRNNKSGNTYAVAEAKSGAYTAELEEGVYTVEIIAVGYNTDYFEIEVTDKSDEEMLSFKLTAEGAAIKIIVEPADKSKTQAYAEIHCVIDSTDYNAYGYVGHTSVYDNTELTDYSTGKLVATYEETSDFTQIISIYDPNAYCDFHFHGSYNGDDYKIKVYLPGQSQPKTFIAPTEPVSFSSAYDYLSVFTISNGEIYNISDKAKQ